MRAPDQAISAAAWRIPPRWQYLITVQVPIKVDWLDASRAYEYSRLTKHHNRSFTKPHLSTRYLIRCSIQPCGNTPLKSHYQRLFWSQSLNWRNVVLFGLPRWHRYPSPHCSHSSGFTSTLAMSKKLVRFLTASFGLSCHRWFCSLRCRSCFGVVLGSGRVSVPLALLQLSHTWVWSKFSGCLEFVFSPQRCSTARVGRAPPQTNT